MKVWTPEAIKDFQARHKLKANEMADMLGIARSYLFMLKNGDKTPSTILCRLLDCLDRELMQRQEQSEAERHNHGKKAKRNIQTG